MNTNHESLPMSNETETPPPTQESVGHGVMSRAGFRAGVLSAIAGGAIIAVVFAAFGMVTGCIVSAWCLGFVAGLAMTGDWK